MPKAKKRMGKRITQAPKPVHRRRKEDGRPKGTLKRFPFEETRLGFFLKYEVPAVYEALMQLTPAEAADEPPLLLIQMICRKTDDPSLSKAKFFRYLKEYAAVGLCCKRPKKLTPERQRYYESIRRKKLAEFIRLNRDLIEGMRQQR